MRTPPHHRTHSLALAATVALLGVLALITALAAPGARSASTAAAPTEEASTEAADAASEPSGSSAPSATLSALLDASSDPCEDEQYESYRVCWEDKFSEVVRSDGMTPALAAVQTVGERFSRVLQSCHEFKHKIGRVSSEVEPDPAAALKFDDRSCQYGYRHGVLEAFAARVDEATLRSTVSSLCNTYPRDGVDFAECLHALGHAASVFYSQDVVAAVTLCDELGDVSDVGLSEPARDQISRDINACAGGALMEFGNSYILAQTGEGLADEAGPGKAEMDEKTGNKLCTVLPERYSDECWLRINMFWGPEYGDDFKTMFARCREEAGSDFEGVCARSLGEWVARMSVRAAGANSSSLEGRTAVAKAAATYCAQGGAGLTGQCMFGVMTPMRRNHLWENRPESEWVDACTLIDVAERPLCNESVERADESYELAISAAPS